MQNQNAQPNVEILRDRARELRKNMTDAERFLWSRIRQRQLFGYKFRRQMPLDYYIADFVCLEKRLIIELDGGQHNLEENVSRDRARTLWLEKQNFRVLRFWNNEVLESIDSVLEVIVKTLEDDVRESGTAVPPPHPSPPPQGGRVRLGIVSEVALK